MSGWKEVAAKVASLGLPALAKIIDGGIDQIPIAGPIIGAFIDPEDIDRVARMALSRVLGVDMTPEAVSAAIEQNPSTEVLQKLQGIQEGLVAQYPALADVFKSDNETDVELARINQESFLAGQRADAASNNYWMSLYRPIALYGVTGAFLYLVGLVLYALTVGGDALKGVAAAENLVMALFTSFVAVLFGHFVTRASERKALLAPPQIVAPPVTVTTPAAKAKK